MALLLEQITNELDLIEAYLHDTLEPSIIHKLPLKAGYVVESAQGGEPVAYSYDEFQELIGDARDWLLNKKWEEIRNQ